MKKYLVLFLLPTIASAGSFSFALTTTQGKVDVGPCNTLKPKTFAAYLEGLNELLKSKNRECVHSADLTTTSRSIECFVPNGPTEAFFYWSETKEECEVIRKKVTGETEGEKYGK